MKKNKLTVARVQTRLLPLYTEPLGDDGTTITDAESFAVDIVADVLIWATHNGQDLEQVLESAARHATTELLEDPDDWRTT
jgi:hypothetical protein